jgi:hypothetical protein
VLKYFALSKNKSVFNWTFCQLLHLKTQLHESRLAQEQTNALNV